MANIATTAIPLRIMKKYKLPGCFYLDIWPFGDSMLVVMDPDVSRAVLAIVRAS